MPRSTLDPLQQRVLIALVGTEPAWTLTGGGALAGVHFGHRATRDLDLFFRRRRSLDRLTDVIRARLVDAGLEVAELHGSPSFQQLRVSAGSSVVIVDLVADPVPTIDAPTTDAQSARSSPSNIGNDHHTSGTAGNHLRTAGIVAAVEPPRRSRCGRNWTTQLSPCEQQLARMCVGP